MSDLDPIKEVLQRKAAEVGGGTQIPSTLVRRARRRVAAVLFGLVLVVGAGMYYGRGTGPDSWASFATNSPPADVLRA